MNIERIQTIIDRIEANPSCHNQNAWHCGTAHCLAGHAQLDSGREANDETCRADAREWLDLTRVEADILFDASRTVEDFKLIASCNWYDSNGYCRNGYDRNGYDRNGYDCDGLDRNGYDCDGYDCDGYGRNGYDCDGYGRNGYDCDGYGRNGYGCDGYDRNGYDRNGYDCDGLDRNNKRGSKGVP